MSLNHTICQPWQHVKHSLLGFRLGIPTSYLVDTSLPWYGRCGETLCTARMKGAPSCYRYTGIEMENTSPNERLTPGQSQTPAIYPPIAIVRQGPEISGDLIDNQQPRATPPQGEKAKRKYCIPSKAKVLIS